MAQMDINKLFNIYFPLAVQQQFQRNQIEGWLQKSLKEHESWGAQQKLTQERASKNRMMELFGMLGKETAPGQPNPMQFFLDAMQKGVSPGITTGLQPPATGYEQGRAGGLEAMQKLLSGEKTPTILEETLSKYGYKPTAEQVGGMMEREEAGKERDVREKKIAVDEKAVEARKMNITQMEENRKTKEKEIQLRRDTLNQKGITVNDSTEKRIKMLEKKATREDKQIKNLTKQLNRLDVVKDAEKINPLLDKIDRLNEKYVETSTKIDTLYGEIDEESKGKMAREATFEEKVAALMKLGKSREDAERLARSN